MYYKEPDPRLISALITYWLAKRDGVPTPGLFEDAYSYWENLFNEYNKAVPPPAKFPNSKLCMTCRPCYMKVYLWDKARIKDESSPKGFEEVETKADWIFTD